MSFIQSPTLSLSFIFVTTALDIFSPACIFSYQHIFTVVQVFSSIHLLFLIYINCNAMRMKMIIRLLRGIGSFIHAACYTPPTNDCLCHCNIFFIASKPQTILNDGYCHCDDFLITGVLLLKTQSVFRQQDGQMSPSCLKLIVLRMAHVC